MKKPRARLQQYSVRALMERIAMDVLGPLLESITGNKYVIIIADYFRARLQQYNVGAPMERIAMDVLGPSSESTTGNKYIIIIIPRTCAARGKQSVLSVCLSVYLSVYQHKNHQISRSRHLSNS